MPTDLSTNNVPFITPVGTTPFTVDVTNCNLMNDLTVKDFVVIVNGAVNSNTNWTKTNRTTLTYTGTAFASAFNSEVRRVTPANRVQEVTYANKFNSAIWEEELNRIARRAYEWMLNGVGAGSLNVTYVPVNAAYSFATWVLDSVNAPTRQAIANIINTLAPKANPTFTGNVTVPDQPDLSNNDNAANTQYVDTRVSNALANSPSLGGNSTATTQAASDDSTRIATTAHVKSHLLTNPVTNTQALGNDSTRIANTAFVQDLHRPAFNAKRNNAAGHHTNLNGVFKPILNAEDYDTDGAFDTTTSRFTVPAGMGGKYRFSCAATLYTQTATTSWLGIGIWVNGTEYKRIDQRSNYASTWSMLIGGSVTVSLNAGDYVEMCVTNLSSGVLYTYFADDVANYFCGERLGA